MKLLDIGYNTRMGIYKIQNQQNGKSYIGSSNRLRIRQKLHLRSLRKGKHHSTALQNSWHKYGESSFHFEIIEEVFDKNLLLVREQNYLDTLKPEYNILKIAGSSLGKKRSIESREKMRMAHLGEKHSEERRRTKSIAQGGENHWTKKKKFSEQAKENMSLAQKKLYASGYISPSKGRKMPISAVEKSRQRNYIKVDQLDLNNNFIKTWQGAKQAQDVLGINAINICTCCKGKSKTAGKFKWKYTNV